VPEIQRRPATLPAERWKWRDKFGQFHAPQEMETRHLFYTLRMLWNHFMPRHMNVGENINRYRFEAFYTPAYFRQAVYHCGRELMQRRDLTPQWKREIEEMASWLRGAEWADVQFLTGPRQMLEDQR